MPTESPFPWVEIPNVDLWDFIFERRDRPFPDDKVIFLNPATDRSYTYAEIRTASIQFGQRLKNFWSWQKGDVLAIFTPNCIDTPAIIWGCLWAGGTVSPVNPSNTIDDLAFQLKESGAKAIVTQTAFLDTVQQALDEAGIREDYIVLIGNEESGNDGFANFNPGQTGTGVAALEKEEIVADRDLAFLVFSSGTTGHPKGVMLSHTNIVANILLLAAGEGETSPGTTAMMGWATEYLHFFHSFTSTALYSGFTAVVMPTFELESFLSLVQSRKITFAYIVPPVLLLLAKHPIVDKYDLSSIRMLSSGAAPLTEDLVSSVYRRLKIPTKQEYGISEMSAIVHAQAWEDWKTPIASVGKLLPNQSIKVMSGEGQELDTGGTGELWVKGPNVFLGYLNNPKETRDALTPDGYFKTGDVGYRDVAGNFLITDRVKEMIKYKGFQIAPAELEGVVAAHPKVADVAVIGLYIEGLVSEVPRAYVVPAQGFEDCEGLEKEIADWVEGKVVNYKRMRGGVKLVDNVPKSASGKILRRVMKISAQEEEDTKGKLVEKYGVEGVGMQA